MSDESYAGFANRETYTIYSFLVGSQKARQALEKSKCELDGNPEDILKQFVEDLRDPPVEDEAGLSILLITLLNLTLDHRINWKQIADNLDRPLLWPETLRD